MPERVSLIADRVTQLVRTKLKEVDNVADSAKILAINASIEAARAAEHGLAFGVVAKEISRVSDTVKVLSDELHKELTPLVNELNELGASLVERVRGNHLTDLALNAVELIDRNLYERSCDVRWWATDSAVTDVCADSNQERRVYAASRLATILASYTVYLDIWVADVDGNVLASGRKGSSVAVNVSNQDWFIRAMATKSGSDYVACDVEAMAVLGNETSATYATAVREGGEEHGTVIGVLGAFFNFAPQANDIVTGVRLSDDERSRTRVMLVDSNFRVIASSDGHGVLTERLRIEGLGKQEQGYFSQRDGTVIGYALTPGYETYRGLGWYGVLIQTPVQV
jgi:hypothetical protein